MLSLVDDEVRFAPDLYRGSAGYYDRYRPPYPEAMITDLVRRVRVSGRGRLLDLACGTGQLTFPLRRWFTEVWAVDSEPDMVAEWGTVLGAEGRVPAGWDLARQRRPDARVLSDAGFEPAGRQEFAVDQRWGLAELAGDIRSTSVLPALVLGDQAAAFDADLAARLGPHSDRGAFSQTVSFACDLARKPARGWKPVT
jgi:SAM-dependent methyltransferase